MDCNYWSCYVHENERLFVGGMAPCQFKTIRNVAQSENYSQYVKVLKILDRMVVGYRIPGIKPSQAEFAGLQEIINFEVEGIDTGIPRYIQKLVHHFLIKKPQIIINLGDWTQHFICEWAGKNSYGYKKFLRLFSYDDQDRTFNFVLFLKLFPNTKVFTIINIESPTKANPSINLSYNFAVKILKCVDYLDTSSVSLSCSRFEIIQPASSINGFIENHKDKFENKGWTLKQEYFVGKGVWTAFNSEKMLLIEKKNQ